MVSSEPPVSMLTCFGRCCKWLLYAFNVLFLCGGIAAIAVGVWAIVDPVSMRVVVLTNSRMYTSAALVLIGAGSAAILVSIMGCFGAHYENRCLIVIYAVLLLLIFVTEFAAGVLSMAFYTQIETLANAEMRNAVVNKYGQGNQWAATDAFNYMQQKFDCCGFEGDSYDGAQLYQASLWFDIGMVSRVPASCCKRNENGDTIDLQRCQNILVGDMTYVNNVGCKKAVLEEGTKFATVISGVGIGLSMLQIFGLVIAFCLYRRF